MMSYHPLSGKVIERDYGGINPFIDGRVDTPSNRLAHESRRYVLIRERHLS